MKKYKELSNTDRAIMDLFWSTGKELSSKEVIEYFNDNHKSWSDKAVLMFLKDLRKKGLLHAEKKNGVYHYSATMTEEEYELIPAKKLLKDKYSGSYYAFLSAMCKKEECTQETIDEIKRMIDELGDE